MTTRLCDANASFSSTRSTYLALTPARASSLRTAGTGPIPITRGSTPATALPTNAPSGSTPRSRARSSDAMTSAAAPSLMPDEVAAVARPPRRDEECGGPVVDAGRVAGRDRAARPERRLQRRELLERRVRARMLVACHVADGDELVIEAAGLGGGGP